MTFLFDIGRVLLDFEFEKSIARLVPSGMSDPTTRIAAMMAQKDDFEAGKIETETFIRWALATLGSDASPDDFRNAWRSIFIPNEPMWQRVHQLAADGHRLVLFSNINGIHFPWIFDEYPDFALFGSGVFSHETGFIKPQPEIYQHAITHHALIPEETIYIDDLAANCAAGRTFGFRTWQYELKNHEAFETWLAAEMQRLESAKSTSATFH